jgi:site-specific DNA-cytosine methylase
MRILELFCGIGGVAAAIGGRAEIVAAVDISRAALGVYAHNFPHPTIAREIETLPTAMLSDWDADLWWLSPPCQPYTRRGAQRDVDDPRARSLLALIDRIAEVRPRFVALENVPEFASSRAHAQLIEMLDRCGYCVHEQLLCPTQLGVPMRRERFYLTAGLDGHNALPCPAAEKFVARPLKDFLDDSADDDPAIRVDPEVFKQYASAIHVVDRNDPTATAHCFTAAYGRSIVRSGSYLQTTHGIRRFSPQEIARLMGFGPSFQLPRHLTTQKAWQLIGISLSVDAVREVLRCIVGAHADHSSESRRSKTSAVV